MNATNLLTDRRMRTLFTFIVILFLAQIFAHGCHAGDHGDADLLLGWMDH